MARTSNTKARIAKNPESGAEKRRADRSLGGGAKKKTLLDLLGQEGSEADFDFQPSRMSDDMGFRIPDFSEDATPSVRPKSATRMTSREFNQNVAKAKRAAEKATVVVTDRGKPAFVLMKYEEYRRLLGKRSGLSERLSDEATRDLEFEPGRIQDGWLRPADLV